MSTVFCGDDSSLYNSACKCSETGQACLSFNVRTNCTDRYYSLTDICLEGLYDENKTKMIGFATADDWEYLTEGKHAGWWASQNHDGRSKSILTSYPFTLEKRSAIRFDWQASSEQDYDFLGYNVLDTKNAIIKTDKISGVTEAATVLMTLEAGTYTIEFSYSKDVSQSLYDDAGYVTNLELLDAPAVEYIYVEWPCGVTLYQPVVQLTQDWTREYVTENSIWYRVANVNDKEAVAKFLSSLRFAYKCPAQGEIKVRIVQTGTFPSQMDSDGIPHYYQKAVGDVSWMEAYNSAKRSTYAGLTGYLATVTTAKENALLSEIIGREIIWLGGTRMTDKSGNFINNEDKISLFSSSFDSTRSDWYWPCGPESGTIFTQGKTVPITVPDGVYTNWSVNEPNNYVLYGEDGEYCMQTNYFYSPKWSDAYPQRAYDVDGYLIEYSAYGDQVNTLEFGHEACIPGMYCCYPPTRECRW